MEDILASIRRIIADDQDGTRGATPDAQKVIGTPSSDSTPTSPSDEEVLDLAEIAEPAPAFTQPHEDFSPFTALDAEGDAQAGTGGEVQSLAGERLAHFSVAEPQPLRAAGPALNGAPPADEPEPRPLEERLLSNVSDAAVSHAFNTLAHTVFAQNAMTLEDVVKDMLRPLLKTWLDDNLPPLVERLVRAEIERVARGGRR